MDVSVASTVTYLPTQGRAQQAGTRGGGAQDFSATTGERSQTAKAELATSALEREQAGKEAARKKDPAAEVASNPGFRFEYQDNRQIMKVHNVKGVLIYQVPSKGQLALIQAEDSEQQRAQQISLTA